MKLHFYEKNQNQYNPEYISEGKYHFIKKPESPCESKKKRFIII